MTSYCVWRGGVSKTELLLEFQQTGIEYRATNDQLDRLEDRYGVTIRRVRPDRSVPVCCKTHGQPFLSKMVSQHLGALQRHDFGWDDMPLALLMASYPDCPKSSLKWWANEYHTKTGAISSYCIGRNKWLREFVMENPPWFPISHKCCAYAKKLPADRSAREQGCDLRIIGTRKSEGGVRSLSGKCFDRKDGGPDIYRPLYWFTNDDRAFYERHFGITHSSCYDWGFKRTGCVGCPFNRDVFEDLVKAEPHEPNVVRAARKVFSDAHEYTRMFNEFMERKNHDDEAQGRLFC